MKTRQVFCGAALVALACVAAAAEDAATFYRAINLNGPALKIDGDAWEAGDTKNFECGDAAFENQKVRLVPPTDDDRARMIRSSRYSSQGAARLRMNELPSGDYSVYLYVWEDNDSQTFTVQLNGVPVAKDVVSGRAGHWQRLGPWNVALTSGQLEIVATGGHANLSGLEVWRGTLTKGDHLLTQPTAPQAPSAETREGQVAMLFARHCLECHNASDHKGGLNLTQRKAVLEGGENGEAIVAGDPDGSLLLDRVEAGEMPPEKHEKLSDAELKLLREWVSEGAKYAVDPIDPFLYTSDRRAGYNWWSLQPIQAVDPPAAENEEWANGAIDRFIGAGLANAKLKPSPAADRRTLIRRLSFDLIGLPPTPEEVEVFVGDNDSRAYERLVDRLLASPHYGERWARHWLDIVRYGESQGFERNKLRPNAWKYRDFVVEAFNRDLPYDEFIRWQLAGDVFAPDDPLAVIASGFLALGPYDLTAYNNGTADMRAFAREEELEGIVATVAQTFMGLTINCARCHDHKFDPITQREFYQFSSTVGGIYQGNERECLTAEGRKTAEKRLSELRSIVEAQPAQQRRLESLKRLLDGGAAHLPEARQPEAWHMLARGDWRQPGEVVTPRGVAAVNGVAADWQLDEAAPEAERRKALASWIADRHNPLTPRVIVNRLWAHHFGVGLVRTPSDFGFQGGAPSHPELLDWLAHELIEPAEGTPWSLKRIQRLIVTSAAYRQSSRANAEGQQIDADNRLVWRKPAQRLEAETFRDAVLFVSGDLDLKLGGPGYRDFKVSSSGDNETYTVFDAVGGEFNRRSLYRTWVRTGTSPLLDLLDCPDPSVATPRRSVTSTPIQALALLNNKFIEHYANRFAERLQREAPNNQGEQLQRVYAIAFARSPTDEELKFGAAFIAEHGLAQFCVVIFNANEFVYVD